MFFKKKKKVQETPKITFYERPAPVVMPRLTVSALDENNNLVEFPYKTEMPYGLCLVRDGEDCFHTFAGCGGFSGFRVMTINEARSKGLDNCSRCYDEIVRLDQDY